MKKLVFAAIAALVMVSVSNVFANDNNQSSLSTVAPIDTVAPTQPADTTVDKQTPVETPATPETPADTTTSTPSVAQEYSLKRQRFKAKGLYLR